MVDREQLVVFQRYRKGVNQILALGYFLMQ